MKPDQMEVLTVEEVAVILRVPERSVKLAIRRGHIRAIRVGRHDRIPRSSVTELFPTKRRRRNR